MEHTAFRSQIIYQLSQTAFVANRYVEAQIPELCRVLGVQQDVLLEARILYKERQRHSNRLDFERRTTGHITTRLKKIPKRTIGPSQYMGVTVATHFREEAVRRQVSTMMLHVSLYYHYLMGTWEPTYIYDSWQHISEKRYKCSPEGQIQPADMNIVAAQAMKYRARKLNTNVSALCRTLIMEMIQGNFAPHKDVEYTSVMKQSFNIHEYPGFSKEELAQLDKELTELAEQHEEEEAKKLWTEDS